jgi:ABC-type maltose transport system permease subunit
MNDQWMLLVIIAVHFFADFTCQGRYLATNKSSNNWVLLTHILVYSLVMGFLLVPLGIALTYIVLNAILHLCTDYVTSRLTTRFFKNGQHYLFWNTIAFDQFAHIAALIVLYDLL